jgi:tRNA (guanosine-2'-O-)-methyltransferase
MVFIKKIIRMRPTRLEKFRRVVACRQPDLTVILENVTDWHNIGAVLRSCDSIGIMEIFVLNTEPHLATNKIVIGKKTSGGARKWVDIQYFTDPAACFAEVRKHCSTILATALGETAKDLYELDLTQPTALLFGNEHSGISELVRKITDGNFIIPQVGMSESLNISVACAVSLYEAYRQRKAAGMYEQPALPTAEQAALLEAYVVRHKKRVRGRMTIRKQD